MFNYKNQRIETVEKPLNNKQYELVYNIGSLQFIYQTFLLLYSQMDKEAESKQGDQNCPSKPTEGKT